MLVRLDLNELCKTFFKLPPALETWEKNIVKKKKEKVVPFKQLRYAHAITF